MASGMPIARSLAEVDTARRRDQTGADLMIASASVGGGEREVELVAPEIHCAGCIARIERAEAWLKQHPGDAALLLTLGRLCAGRSLWGKAQSYLEASLAIEPTFSGHLAAGRLQESLGNAEAARRHYRESLELALAQLKQVTGGRRRVPI